MAEFDHLWNDLPFEERARLAPFQIQCQILQIEQVKAVAVNAHKQHMAVLDGWLRNLRKSLTEKAAEAAA